MKRILFIALTVLLAAGCYDDAALWDQIRDHEERIVSLEKLCNQMNTNISSLQAVVTALQDKDYVTNVAPIKENGKEIGYTITFSKSGSITIYHGNDGENGKDGADGKNGSTPVIGVRLASDGVYYWTIDGEWLLDSDGNRIPTTGKDGADGADGEDGKDGADGVNGKDGVDGITPQLKIEEDYWYISYDNGQTWDKLGKAVGEDGKDGADGADGENGKDGANGDSFFKSVTQDEENVYITLADGTAFTLPKAEVSYVTLDMEKTGDDYAIFKGKAKKKPVDLKVTVYYGKEKKLTLYNCEGKGTVTDFTDSYSFRLLLEGLEPDREYYYFTEIVFDGTVTYGQIESFKTTTGLEYIDEYGESRGLGIEIDGVIWAPVNCGYHPTDYKYGKLYQWGRKYGQGYEDDTYSDATTPVLEERQIVFYLGSENQYADKFFTNQSDWSYVQIDNLWNSGSEENPVKTEYDPCPDGWRVPTKAELEGVFQNYSDKLESEGQNGRWFTGSQEYTSDSHGIFLPTAGYIGSTGKGTYRGKEGRYWSSFREEGNRNPYRLSVSSPRVSRGISSQGESIRCVKDNGYMMPVQSVIVDKPMVTLTKGESVSLSASIYPSNANHKEVSWYSEDELIATVDQNGLVTMVSEGSTRIWAVAGMCLDNCIVSLKQNQAPAEGDYVDEYNINHGQGVEIDGVVWAPVNCGYHKEHYKYGKLYQWGRLYGQGYYNSYDESYNDARAPWVIESKGEGSSVRHNIDYANVFFLSNSKYEYDYLYPHLDKSWNFGLETEPLKTPNDPCPDGWRVPTAAELENLIKNYSDWTRNGGQYGYWFSGSVTYSTNVNRLFLPAAGYHHCESEEASSRNTLGEYMSSIPLYYYAKSVAFHERNVDVSSALRANGLSVRCVKE